jgi:hypothetical protein
MDAERSEAPKPRFGVKTRSRAVREWSIPSGTVHPMKAATLKQLIEQGEYQVDPVAVADAILRRALAQNACSYPISGPSASVKTSPGEPSTTDPIQVTLLRALALAAGTQTHNS